MKRKQLYFILAFFCLVAGLSADSLLEKQTANHFRKYLSERNRFEDIEYLGGPFQEEHYAKTSSDATTYYQYKRPLGIMGDPNEIKFETCLLAASINVGPIDIAALQNMDTRQAFHNDSQAVTDALVKIFKIVENEHADYWLKDEISFIHTDEKGRILKEDVRDTVYFCGIESLDDEMWQLYFRRGHRIDDYQEIEYMPLFQSPADILKAKSDNKPADTNNTPTWTCEFFLFGQMDESTLSALCDTLKKNRTPIAAATVEYKETKVVYSQKQNAEPFRHPFLNAPAYSVILKNNNGIFWAVSVSAVEDETPQGIHQGYGNGEILLEKPPAELVNLAVQKTIYPDWCDADRAILTPEDMFEICELYLRVPCPEINYPYMEIEKDKFLTVQVSPQDSGDFGRPTLSLIKINGKWRVYDFWDLEDF